MNVYDFTATNNRGEAVSLRQYEGKALLIVNTATHCGFTPQYEGLQRLYEAYREEGFEILDFPCNQFAFQAPGSAETIDAFCERRYRTTFPRFAKIKVNGGGEAPLYGYLKSRFPGRIRWNFTKFLIDRIGEPVARFAPSDTPEALALAVERLVRK